MKRIHEEVEKQANIQQNEFLHEGSFHIQDPVSVWYDFKVAWKQPRQRTRWGLCCCCCRVWQFQHLTFKIKDGSDSTLSYDRVTTFQLLFKVWKKSWKHNFSKHQARVYVSETETKNVQWRESDSYLSQYISCVSFFPNTNSYPGRVSWAKCKFRTATSNLTWHCIYYTVGTSKASDKSRSCIDPSFPLCHLAAALSAYQPVSPTALFSGSLQH